MAETLSVSLNHPFERGMDLPQDLELFPSQQTEIEDILSLFQTEHHKGLVHSIANEMHKLPIDASTLIAGWAYWAIDKDLMAEGQVLDRGARQLIATLRRLSNADSAATSTALLQERRNRSQADNVRKMLVALIDDPRVVVLKLLERLIRLQVGLSGSNDEADLLLVANEVLHFYAPLASRLGIWQLKWVLEDAAFQVIEPLEYDEIAQQLKESRSQREIFVHQIEADLGWRLREAGIAAVIRGRAKNIYGIQRKMREKNLRFEDVQDVMAIRVLVDSVPECYQILGIVHTAWSPIMSAFDDYIATPKSNGYQSLHTAVIGPKGFVFEVQIRTKLMHENSELGVCSHWSYKGEDDSSLKDPNVDWMREVLNWHEGLFPRDEDDEADTTSKSNRVTYVLTPQRHIVDLPAGSTVLDFAFKVHTELGLHSVAALVDGTETPLNAVLDTGQTVEIKTDVNSYPTRDWLDPDLGYFTIPKTHEVLRTYFRSVDGEQNVDIGRRWVNRELKRLNIELSADAVAERQEPSKPDDFFFNVALGLVSVRESVLDYVRSSPDLNYVDRDRDEDKYTVRIYLFAVDRAKLASDITGVIADLGINVVHLQLGAPALGEEAKFDIWAEIESLAQAFSVVAQLRRLSGVTDVHIYEP